MSTAAMQSPEPWVDIKDLAKHLGFDYQATRKMVQEGKIPGKPFVNGKKTYWRFKLSVVDEALMGKSPESTGLKSVESVATQAKG